MRYSCTAAARQLLLLACLVATLSAAAPPNVFFLVDDLGWRDLGCYGNQFYETPNIDGLVRSGSRFPQAYAACPACSPTRATVMTGKYAVRMRVTEHTPTKVSDGRCCT